MMVLPRRTSCSFSVKAAGLLSLVLCFLDHQVGRAQVLPQAESDSLLSYDLDEIVIQDGSVFEAEANTVHKVSIADIERRNAGSVSELARLIPATHVQTNSRGESLIYVRNAGERQVALFFNGALLNIPWDNRINLDLVPASVIGGVTVSKGVPSVLYGTNVLGGAVNIRSRTLEDEGTVTEISGAYGDHRTFNGAFTHLRKHYNWTFSAAVGYQTREGMPLPGDAELPFSQPDLETRTNTDREAINVFGQAGYAFNNGLELGLSYLFVDGGYGIAPEGHLNPVDNTIRFWRYPLWQNNTVILNGLLPTKGRAVVRGAIWSNWFRQTIDAYRSVEYENLAERQEDEDKTLGTRITWLQPLGSGTLSLALNGLRSEHEEVARATDEMGVIAAPDPAPAEQFSQWVYSSGLEYAFDLQEGVRVNLGGSFDGLYTPETGDKPSIDAFSDYGLSAGVQYLLPGDWVIRGAAGRKVRFPTMRELFGVALNRFVLNPDLRPESSFVTELALSRRQSTVTGELIGFYQRTFDTIDQRNVEVEGQSRRERINLEGSRVWGIESTLTVRLHPLWTLDGHLTWMNPRALEDGRTLFLTEKPEWLGGLSVIYNRATGVSIFAEAVFTGKAYGLDVDNTFIDLDPSLIIDARVSYRLFVGSLYAEAFVRVDNALDAVRLPQPGLPGPGRRVASGLNFSF